MRIMVTGSGGFLGGHLVRHLLDASDAQTVAVTSQPTNALKQKFSECNADISSEPERLVVISNNELLSKGFLQPTDIIVHCAFPWNRSGAEMADGLRYQHQLYKKAATQGVQTFINVSSQSVYVANREKPANEASAIELDSPYATAKFAMEMLGTEILDVGSLINVRMGSLIGRGYDLRILNRFIRQAFRGEEIVVQNAEQHFSYMDVRDACRALTLIALNHNRTNPTVVNVGTEKTSTLSEIARAAIKAAALAKGIKAVAVHRPVQTHTAPRFTLDCTLVKDLYGFEATIPLHDTAVWIAAGMCEA